MTGQRWRPLLVATAALAGAALAVAGCGSQPQPGASTVVERARPPGNLVSADYTGRFRAVGLVLEDAGHGPQLCLGAVTASMPPQCGGPDIVGWDWDAVEHHAADGTRTGSYVLVGTFDGQRFILTQPAAVDVPTPDRPPMPSPDFTSPCPEPAGGWRPVDPERATDAALQATAELARSSTGFGALWIDQPIPNDQLATASGYANDPQRFVLNVTTTGDIAATDYALREVWGGSLCVSRAVRSEAQLAPVQQALTGEPGLLGVSTDFRAGQVVLEVHRATTERQRQLDAAHGAGTVRLTGMLVPID